MPSRDLATWMWAEACDALVRAEQLQRQFFRPASQGKRPGWEPPVDIFETDRELWIVAALPGVEARLVEITIADGVVTIAGERRPPAAQRVAAIHRMEIPLGRFERRIVLPAGRFELARRDLADGCLTLTLIKRG
jgi:HSP20 family molecular chaperone IbpA